MTKLHRNTHVTNPLCSSCMTAQKYSLKAACQKDNTLYKHGLDVDANMAVMVMHIHYTLILKDPAQ